jgi:p190RhoGAP, pG1 and pG2 domains
MCLFCGDPFGPERLLAPLVGLKGCLQTGVRSVLLEQEVRAKNRRVEIILSSYHSATDFRQDSHQS